jgi:3D (Asp-Asp-Asp) domain-containing protein
LRKRPTSVGSAFSVVLLFSVISYGEGFIKQQEPKRSEQVQKTLVGDSAPASVEIAKLEVPVNKSAAHTTTHSNAEGKSSQTALETIAVPTRVFTATAYSLHGRTASGRAVSRGLIAADPALLPLGTRVRVEAGSFSGDYLVADTGGAVRGRRIDIWTPTVREAMQFGRRAVKLTVLSFGTRHNKRTDRQLLKDKTTNPNPAK